jgi:leader peptidase (prepilin peptidase)/N-methyltransferase
MDPTAAARVFTVVVSGLFGLVVGSFLNVVVYRLPLGMSVARPPSHCPSCDTELKPADNIPLFSWLFLRGRCRYCRAPISARYPIVELTTGLAFAGLAWSLGSLRPLPSLLLLAAAALAAAAIDLDGHPVPWAVDVAAALGAVSLVVVAAVSSAPGRIGWAALGGAVSGAAALLPDRSPRGARRAVAVAALGWSASWLWAPGGLVLAAWVVAVAVAFAVGRRRARPRATAAAPSGSRAAGEGTDPPNVSAVPMVVVAVGAFGLLLAGAAVGAPF